MTTNADYYTVAELSELLRVSQATIRRWIGSGRLPAVRVRRRAVRVRRRDLERAMPGVRGPGLSLPFDAVLIGTPDEDQDALVDELEREQARQAQARHGRRYSSSVDLIREAREERMAEL
jgi:excisionase family DNA binding protein